MPIDKYFEIIDYCNQYSDYGNQPFTSSQIVKNAHNKVLDTGLYTKPTKMWHKNTTSEKLGMYSISSSWKTYQHNISGFSWGQHGHSNARQY